MPDDHPPSFVTRIRRELPQMHPAERRLADFVLNFPGELASYTASELARLANVSNATVSRFMQRLGYANYDEARRHVRSERQTGAVLFMVGADEGSAPRVLRAHAEQGIANLEKTFYGLSLEEIDTIAAAMLKARHVWVVGFRAGHSFATYLQWQTFQVMEHISVLPQAGQTLGEHIAGMTADDCAIVFGLRRRIRGIDDILGQIVATGARTLYITDETVPRKKEPAWHIQCQTPAPGPLFNHTAVLALCHLLATRVIEKAGAAGRKRLSAIEAIHDALDEL
jgi:DNA-binding MurR/RpiR family transcriptional regulator